MEAASSVGKSEPTSLVETSRDKERDLELLGFCKGEGTAPILAHDANSLYAHDANSL